MRAPRTHCRAGYSLYEVVIVVGLLGLVMAAAGLVSSSTSNLARFSGEKSRTESKAHRTLDRVVTELTTVARALMTPDPLVPAWTSALDFQCANGVAAGLATFGPLTRLVLEYEPGELDDGVDNDGDGLVDEGRLVLVRNQGGPGQQRVVLCTGVAEYAEGETGALGDQNGNGLDDERGFHLRRVGDLMVVSLTLQEMVEEGQVLTLTSSTSFRLRN